MSKNASATITSIQLPVYEPGHVFAGHAPKVYHVFYSNGKVEHISQRTQPRRFEAVKRFIGGQVWKRSDVPSGALLKRSGKVPTLAESFADAAIGGLERLAPEHASNFESGAAYEEFIALSSRTILGEFESLRVQRDAARRAITYRWTARALISGKADRAALVEALEGIEL